MLPLRGSPTDSQSCVLSSSHDILTPPRGPARCGSFFWLTESSVWMLTLLALSWFSHIFSIQELCFLPLEEIRLPHHILLHPLLPRRAGKRRHCLGPLVCFLLLDVPSLPSSFSNLKSDRHEV